MKHQCFPTSCLAAEYHNVLLLLEAVQNMVPVAFVSSFQRDRFEAIRFKQPGHAAASHSSAPAMEKKGAGIADLICLGKEGMELRADQLEPFQNCRLFPFLSEA